MVAARPLLWPSGQDLAQGSMGWGRSVMLPPPLGALCQLCHQGKTLPACPATVGMMAVVQCCAPQLLPGGQGTPCHGSRASTGFPLVASAPNLSDPLYCPSLGPTEAPRLEAAGRGALSPTVSSPHLPPSSTNSSLLCFDPGGGVENRAACFTPASPAVASHAWELGLGCCWLAVTGTRRAGSRQDGPIALAAGLGSGG